MTPVRTLKLVEYQPREVRLRPTEAAALAPWATQLRIEPLARSHGYRITSLGWVGVLALHEFQIVVQPKIAAANVANLLDPEQGTLLGAVAGRRSHTMVNLVAQSFLQLLQAYTVHGLPRQYVEVEEPSPFLQGRLNVAAHAREPSPRRDIFHVQHEIFTTDSPLHQGLKWCVVRLRSWPGLAEVHQERLRALLPAFEGVQCPERLPVLPTWFAQPVEQTLAEQCHWIAAGMQPHGVGEMCGPTFWVNMASVFEQYVTRALVHARPQDVQVQPTFCYHAEPVPNTQPTLRGNPDIVVGSVLAPRVVLDVKWKALDDGPSPADVQQVLGYAVGLGCKDVRLVYPSRRDTEWPYELPHGGRLTIHALRVTGSTLACRRSLGHFVTSLFPPL